MLTFLVINFRRIGDVLLTTPLVRSLRAAHPKARIDMLVFRGTEGILEGNPDLDNVYTLPTKPRLAEYRDFLSAHGRAYHWAITTQSGDRPAFLALLAGKHQLTVLTGDPRKDWWRRSLLTRSVAIPTTTKHIVNRNLFLADVLGIEARAEIVPPRCPGFDVPAALGFAPQQQPFVVCHPVPKFTYKRWPYNRWEALIARQIENGFRVVISGGKDPAELAAIGDILGDFDTRDVINLAGRLSLAELAEVLKQASAYYGPDTSVTHLAAALGIPVTAIYGPTNPSTWGPWPVSDVPAAQEPWLPRSDKGIQRQGNVTLIQDTLPCVPCHEEGCEHHLRSESECLHNVSVARVLDKA